MHYHVVWFQHRGGWRHSNESVWLASTSGRCLTGAKGSREGAEEAEELCMTHRLNPGATRGCYWEVLISHRPLNDAIRCLPRPLQRWEWNRAGPCKPWTHPREILNKEFIQKSHMMYKFFTSGNLLLLRQWRQMSPPATAFYFFIQ